MLTLVLDLALFSLSTVRSRLQTHEVDTRHLMVEETDMLLDKSDAKTVSSRSDSVVVLTPERCADVLDARAAGAVDVVCEGELCKILSACVVEIKDTQLHRQHVTEGKGKDVKTHKRIAATRHLRPVSYTHLTLPTKRIV